MNERESKPDERQLIVALAKGDQEAFRYILERNRSGIIRICRGFVRSHEDAEDIAQEVFIELFRSVSRLRGEAKVTTWLYRVAVNKSLNFIRSNRAKQESVHSEIDSGLNVRSDQSADGSITESEHRSALYFALDKLPDNQRTAFVLNKYEDLSYSEIAIVMNLSVSSVQSLIFRAKRSLQEKLRDYFDRNIK